jgi:hypothetical protein
MPQRSRLEKAAVRLARLPQPSPQREAACEVMKLYNADNRAFAA